MNNLPVIPFKGNAFSSVSKGLIWDAAGYGVVLLKTGWEVVLLVFAAAAGVAWICYRTQFITATLTVLDKNQ